MHTVVTERGQVSIPAELRRELHLTPGTELAWEQVGPDDLRVRVIRPAVTQGGLRAALGWARRFRETRTTAEWMEELRGDDHL